MVAGGNITYLEQLINEAAGTHRGDSLQSQKTLSWDRRHIHALYCAAEGRHEAGDLIRQAIKSDFREFANIIGPNRHLTLDLFAPDPHDSLNSFEYIDARRQLYEARHNNDRAKFQQDEDWRKIMFYYFLFSEYKVNYDQPSDQ